MPGIFHVREAKHEVEAFAGNRLDAVIHNAMR